MSKRELPRLPSMLARMGLHTQPSARAVERWNSAVMASTGDGENVIRMFDVIGEDWLGGGVTAKKVAAALDGFKGEPVTAQINSPGGDFFEGLAIYNLLRDYKGEITVKVLGLAASAASVIAMAGDRIEMARASFMMIHNVWVMAIGNRNDLRDIADTLEPFDQVAIDLYAARTGLAAKDVAAMMDRETFIGGQAAVDKGFADALLPADEGSAGDKPKQEFDQTILAHRLDALLAKAGMPRSERRALIKQMRGTPSAAQPGTPGAAETAISAETMNGLQAALTGLRGL